MEGGVRVTEESIINGIPIYTYEDYISSTTPYEYAYQYIDDSFTLERVITQMSNNELTSLEYLLKRTMEKNSPVIIRFYRLCALSTLIRE